MAMRLKTKWANKSRERSPEEIAGALAFTIWRIGMQGVLNLENENFQTDSNSQRMDVVEEFNIFTIHLTDRIAHEKMTDAERETFIVALVLKVTDFVQDNRQDSDGEGDYRRAFIDLVNERMSDYSECTYSPEDGPGFSLKRTFGDHVSARMGEKDRKWITEYVMEIEVPEAMATLKRALKSLLNWE